MDGLFNVQLRSRKRGAKNNIVSHYHSVKLLFKPLQHVKEFKKNCSSKLSMSTGKGVPSLSPSTIPELVNTCHVKQVYTSNLFLKIDTKFYVSFIIVIFVVRRTCLINCTSLLIVILYLRLQIFSIHYISFVYIGIMSKKSCISM